MSQLAKFVALPWSDRARLAACTLLLPGLSLGLKAFGFQKVYRYLAAHPALELPCPGPDETAVQKAQHTASLVSIAARYGPYRATCLHQALLLWWLLRRQRILSELRIGVQQGEGKFYAHAWVRCGEVVISEGSQVEAKFSAFEGFPLN